MADLNLTTIEATRLVDLEATIEQGLRTFVEVGNALLEIREQRLYREQYPTFEEYCGSRWALKRQRAYELMEAATVVNNLSEISDKLPTRENHAAALSKLTPQLQRTVWPIVVETAPNGNITGAYVEQVVDNFLADHAEEADRSFFDESQNGNSPNNYNYKRDNRRSVAADIYTPQGMDACQTPAYAIDPVLRFLKPDWVIWEPACGEGLMVEALYDGGYKESQVVASDILSGQNFFEYEPDGWDALVTNPPYSIQFQWLERCYELGKPFALLLKVEVLGTKTAQEMFERFGIEVIFVSPRINFKMPHKGWGGGGAQFPTAWFTWGLGIGQQMTFAKVDPNGEFDEDEAV